MSTKPYAEVIVDVTAKRLDRAFHYSVPQDLRGRLAEGMRVIVPFGNRKVEGYILGFSDHAEVSGIREIIGIVEEIPLIGRDLTTLAAWISDRYMCSKIDAIRCMMPAGARMKGRKYVQATGLSLPGQTELLAGSDSLIYEYVLEKGKVPYKEICELVSQRKCRDSLQKLVGCGLIEVIEEMKAKARPHYIQLIGMMPQGSEITRLIEQLTRKAPKQADVLRVSRDMGPLPAAELARRAGTTPGTVRELIKKGYLAASRKEVFRDPLASRHFDKTEPMNPTADQLKALKAITGAIDSGKQVTFLLHGVTGSGKTEVYLQAIAHCLKKGRQAIVLVPEISLTPQMVERFRGRFGELVAVLHSRLSTGERFDEWKQIKEERVQVVVGARSAVFAPFADPGLIIIDEEHETSYKQEDNPKYHAREVAIARAQLNGSVVVLGSATPSLESYTRAALGRYKLLSLDRRVLGRPLPVVEVVDLRKEMRDSHRSIFSRRMVEKVTGALERKEQVILFLNRRGYSTFVVCRECGLVMKCSRCSISLTLHAGENLLRCHYCDYRVQAPAHCPQCGSGSIRHFGIGTQKVEEEVKKWFPEARAARMDMDTTARKGSHEQILNQFKEGRIDILIGTQMIAKGLDFPGVTLVGVITADTALNLPDFRSAERTFQLLTQVAGRAGRGDMPGEVLIQTYNPEHYSIVNAQTHNYTGFYKEEMNTRQALEYPPYCSLVRIVIYGNEENSVIRGADILAANLSQILSQMSLGVDQPMLGPAPAPLSKLRNRYRWQICLKGKPGKLLRQAARDAVARAEQDPFFGNLGMSVDVDPLGIL